MTAFETLLSDPYASRHYLVELYPYDPGTETETALYYSDHGFTVGSEGGSLDHQHFDARVVEALNFQRSMFRPEAIGGSSIPSFGEIQLANGDGALDFFRDLAFDGRSVVVRLGGEGFTYADYGVIFSGTAQSATVDEEKVIIRLRDLQYKLQTPVQTVLYEEPPGDALDLAFGIVVTAGNDYYYANNTSVVDDYQFQAGDYLEYEVFWSPEGPQIQRIGVDMITDQGALRGSGAVDQNGLSAHPSTDLRPYAEGKWYHRVIEIPAGLIGGRLAAHLLACEFEETGGQTDLDFKSTVRGAIRNIEVTDGAGTQRFSVWQGSDPLPTLTTYLTSNPANGVTVERLLNLEGDPNLVGKPKPLCFGHCLNVRPVLVSPNLLTYQVHGGGPIQAIDAVYDKGVELVGPAGPGPQYSVDLERGTFTLNQQPIGEITADVRGDATDEAYVETVADVMARLVTTYGPLEAAELDTATFDALNLSAPSAIGLYITTERNTLEVLDELINSIGGFYGFDRAGLMCVGRFEAPDPLSAIVLNGVDSYVAVDGLFYDRDDYRELTVEVWVRTSATNSQFLASWDRSEYWRLGIGTGGVAGALSFNMREGKSQAIVDLSGTKVINDDRWHHVAVVFDEGTVRFFVDGELDGSLEVGASIGRGEGVVRYGFWGIGSEAFTFDGATNVGTNANCRLAEGRIWSVARDEGDLKWRLRRLQGDEPGLVGYWRFDEGAGTTVFDGTGNGYHGYFRGGTGWNSVLTIGPAEILGIENVPTELPLWRQRVSYQRNWTVMTADSIAGAVTDERRNFLTEELRLVTVKDESIQDKHLLARDPEATRTLLHEEAAAQEEAERLFELYRQQRNLYRITVKTQPFKVELGDQVQVAYPRFGLDGGRVFRVIGLEERAEINRVTLELWG